MTESGSRLRPGLLAIELVLIAALFWADEQGWIPLSKTPFLLIVAWGSMRLRGVGWRDIGLRLPLNWRWLAATGVAAGVAMWLLEFFFTMPMLQRVLGYWPDLSTFNDLVGSARLLLIYLALNWVLAAFGEEMVWRGYALPRVAQFFGDDARAWLLALLIVNLGFGLAHMYQGPSGMIQATVAGVILGLLYLATGRNLVVPVLAHGVSNSIDFTVMYLGWYPGVGQ
jgi:CAAX protease family protein